MEEPQTDMEEPRIPAWEGETESAKEKVKWSRRERWFWIGAGVTGVTLALSLGAVVVRVFYELFTWQQVEWGAVDALEAGLEFVETHPEVIVAWFAFLCVTAIGIAFDSSLPRERRFAPLLVCVGVIYWVLGVD